jgi:two-component system chemotaxis sensor kinase CheA
MRDAITRTRMQRIENLFVALPRMVRDLSSELGKQVLVDIDGGDVETGPRNDRDDPRSADPHHPQCRRSRDRDSGRPLEGRQARDRPAVVSARQSGNQILIEIADDGKGIDGSKLVEKALANGVIERDVRSAVERRAARPDLRSRPFDRQGSHRHFRPGVGMDVVRSNVSASAAWSRSTRARQGNADDAPRAADPDDHPALTVSIGKQHFAIPRSAIEEIVRANGASVTLETIGGAGVRDHSRPPRA